MRAAACLLAAGLPSPSIAAETAACPATPVRWLLPVLPGGGDDLVVGRLHADIALTRIIRPPDPRDRLASEGGEVVGNTPDPFGAFIARERETWRSVAREARATPDCARSRSTRATGGPRRARARPRPISRPAPRHRRGMGPLATKCRGHGSIRTVVRCARRGRNARRRRRPRTARRHRPQALDRGRSGEGSPMPADHACAQRRPSPTSFAARAQTAISAFMRWDISAGVPPTGSVATLNRLLTSDRSASALL